MKTTRIQIGKPYKFNCVKCGNIMDREGKVCCNCMLFTGIKAMEKTKAEYRAITQIAKKYNPKLLLRMKEEAKDIAISKIEKEYGVKLR